MAERPTLESRLDRIHIRELRARCIVGIFSEEREKKQEVEINITIYADLSKASLSDNIDDTIDYKKIKKRVLTFVEKSSFYLVERLASGIAATILENPAAVAVDVSVDKPGALRFARSVAIDIRRTRNDVLP